MDSFPVGLCDSCKRLLYRYSKTEDNSDAVEPREARTDFNLEKIKVPRISAYCTDCPCPICRCAKFNPIGFCGAKNMINKTVINVEGGKMDSEIQQKVLEHSNKYCSICLHVMGK